MGRNGKTIKWWTRWIGIIAMLVHMSVPFGHGMSFAAFTNGGDDRILPLVICSAMGGIVHIPADGNSENGGQNIPLDKSAPCSCEFCLTSHFSCHKVILYPVAAVPMPIAVALVYPQNVDDSRISGWSPVRHRQRAPPSFT